MRLYAFSQEANDLYCAYTQHKVQWSRCCRVVLICPVNRPLTFLVWNIHPLCFAHNGYAVLQVVAIQVKEARNSGTGARQLQCRSNHLAYQLATKLAFVHVEGGSRCAPPHFVRRALLNSGTEESGKLCLCACRIIIFSWLMLLNDTSCHSV